MLLQRRSEDGVEVLQVDGCVLEHDVDRLTGALEDALCSELRGVVVDLSRTEGMAPTAVEALRRAAGRAGRWPRASLAVCAAPEDVRDRLEQPVQLHDDRRAALAHVDDRSPAPRLVLELEPGQHAPAQARAVARTWSAKVGLDEVCEDLLLVVSELVTNAVRYGVPPLHLELEAAAGGVTVAVADGAPARPVPQNPDDDAERGRGMLIIDLVAAERGVRPVPPGKAVWAELARP